MPHSMCSSREFAKFYADSATQLEPGVGIEPTTYHLQGGCSTTELTRRVADATPAG